MRINALGNTATDFASDDYIALDGATNGSRKMAKSKLLELTSLNVFKRTTTGVTDLNDFNDTGYYRVESTMAHYPSGASNGLLVVFSAGESRKLQILESSVATPSRLSRMFYRVGEFNTNTWGAWEEIGSASQSLMRFELNASADLNDCVNNGYYCLSGSWTWTNKPTGFSYGFMLVFTQSTRTFQLIADQANNKVYYRNLVSGTWTDWAEFADISYVQSAINALDTKVFNTIKFPNKLLSFGELPDVQTLLNTNIEPETSVARLAVYNLGTYNTYYFYAQSDVEVYFDDDVISDANYLSVAYGTNPSGTWVPVPDSSSNRRYMQCSAVARKRKSNNDLPTSNAKLTIPAGSIIAFTQRNTDSAKVNINCYPELSPALPVAGPKKMNIKYSSSDSYKISFGDYECELYKVVNVATDADNWNVVHISHNGSDIIGRWTDIIGPLKISGDDDFIGGVHGSETTNSLYVYAGSKKLTLDSSLDEEFEKLTIIMNSTCRRKSNQADAFSRSVCVEITRNKMHISSEYVCISSSSLIVTRVSNGGLISANNNVILGCYMDNYNCDGYPLSAPNNKSKYNTHAVIVTTLGTIVVDNIKGHEQEDYKGWFNLFDQEVVPRTKIYFEPYNGTGKTITAGDKFYGECEYKFEP